MVIGESEFPNLKTTSRIARRNLFELSEDEKKQTLDDFLVRNAISKQQYDKSLGNLKVKMGINKY